VTICSEDSVAIGSVATGGTPPYSYSWSPADGLGSTIVPTPPAYPATTTRYTVTVTDANGCSVSDAITVRPGAKLRVLGGLNDDGAFSIDSTGILDFRCRSLRLMNGGFMPIVIEGAFLSRNIEFSLPPSQLPLVIPPGEMRDLDLCFAPTSAGEERDTLYVFLDCPVELPLVAHGRRLDLLGADACGTTLRLRGIDSSELLLRVNAHSPNPASSGATLGVEIISASGGTVPPLRCLLRDMLGNVVAEGTYRARVVRERNGMIEQQGAFTLDLSRLPQGLYFATVSAGEGSTGLPVVVRR
jgi:hypothetical protein